MGYKVTCRTDGRYVRLLYVDPANRHDITIIKKNREDFAERLKGCIVLLDKGYIDSRLAEEMERRGVKYIAIKRRNMIKSEGERVYYLILFRIRRLIETRFSQLEEYGLRFVRAITRKGLAIKIITAILAFNIYQTMEAI